MLMVHAMPTDPAGWRVLSAAEGDRYESAFQPFGNLEAAMREQPVVADWHTQLAKQRNPELKYDQAGPTEQPRNENEECQQMNDQQRQEIIPAQANPGSNQGQWRIGTQVPTGRDSSHAEKKLSKDQPGWLWGPAKAGREVMGTKVYQIPAISSQRISKELFAQFG
jgi:hypothetical protein